MSNHWMVRYKLFMFYVDWKSKMSTSAGQDFPMEKYQTFCSFSKITAPLKVNFVGIVPVIALYKIILVCIKQKYKMATTTGHIVMVHFTQRLHSWIGDHSWFWLSCLDPLVLLLHLTSQSFDFERIWWRLFWAYLMKVIPEMHTKFDISVFIDGTVKL